MMLARATAVQTVITETIARLSFEAYRAIPAVNHSTLKYAALSLLQYREACDHPKPDTAATRLGRAVHTSVLEPDEFPRRYVVAPDGIDRRTAAGKTTWAALEATGREVAKPEVYEACLRMRDAVRSHPVAGPLVAKGRAELSVTWTDAASKLLCKVRPDFIPDDNGSVLLDLKTTRNPFPWAFARDVAKYAYHRQAAFYREGWFRATGQRRDPWLIAVQSVAPWEVWVYSIPAAVLAAAWEEQSDGLASLLCKVAWAHRREAELIAAGKDGAAAWAGGCSEVNELYLPSYVPGAELDATDGLTIGG